MTLAEFFDAEGRGAQAKMARELDCSKGYLSEIADGKKFPARDFALRIQNYTQDRVQAATVMGLEAA